MIFFLPQSTQAEPFVEFQVLFPRPRTTEFYEIAFVFQSSLQ